jgi:hypothetical protein
MFGRLRQRSGAVLQTLPPVASHTWPIPAILAGSLHDREVSTRNPRSRYPTADRSGACPASVTTGGIGARSGVDSSRSCKTICGQRG